MFFERLFLSPYYEFLIPKRHRTLKRTEFFPTDCAYLVSTAKLNLAQLRLICFLSECAGTEQF